jgi:hypothetical protein
MPRLGRGIPNRPIIRRSSQRLVEGSATLSASTALAGTGTPIRLGAAALSAAGVLGGIGTRMVLGAGSLAATGSLAGTGLRLAIGSAHLTAAGVLQGSGFSIRYGVGSLGAEALLVGVGLDRNYELYVRDPAGTFETLLAHAVNDRVGTVDEELNGAGTLRFALGLYDEQAPLCDPALGREIVVKRDGQGLWVGPIVTDDADLEGDVVTFGCEGLLSYFADRNIDRGAGRINHLQNPEFEDDAVGTAPASHWPEFGITSEVDNAQHVLGTRSLKLTQATPSVDTYVHQDIVFNSGGIGDLLTLAAWFYIDNSGSWVGPALEGWGLVIKQTDGGVNVYDFQASVIDSDTPRGSWQRAEVTTWLPPNVTRTVECRLYGPGGVIWWDALSLTEMESLSKLGEDQASIAGAIVLFLQGQVFGFTDVGKSDLGITTDTPATGITRDRTYQFADHTSGDTALGEFASMDDGFDYAIGVDRVFRTYFPRQGTDRTGTVTLVGDQNCILRRKTTNRHQGASQVVQLGAGDGPDREEGAAEDDTVFGGVTVQRIMSPKGSPAIDTLRPTAIRELAVAKTPIHYEAVLIDPALRETIRLGDVVAAALDHGYVQETRNLRVVTRSRSIDTDTVTLGLNIAQ